MSNIKILTRAEATPESQTIFDQLQAKLGKIPNLYAVIGNSSAALKGILNFGETLSKGTLTKREIEAVALAVGQANDCNYCLAAHTAIGKLSGFTAEETLAIRDLSIEDAKLNALATLAYEITRTRGKPGQALIDQFFAVGYSQGALAEVIGLVALNTFTNYTNHIANTPLDFPVAPALRAQITI